jgi:Protein of unknown function (DUF2868)
MPRVDLARVVDLAAALDADARVDPEARRRRDRALGREIAAREDDATARVAAWLDAHRVPGPTSGERARAAQRVLRALLAIAGGALGTATAFAVFAYDGGRPVDVMHVIAAFVMLPIALLAGTVVLTLPESWRARVPGLAAIQDVLRLASPGRWQPALRRVLQPAQREALDRAIGTARRHQRLYGDAQKWALLVGSQLFAVSFYAAALAVAVLLVVFSDLAFGWSTTLTSEAGTLHRAVTVLAAPWSHWLPGAAPSRELVEQTQYFRGAGGFTGAAPQSTAWWPFLLLCMACYGLAPRVALLVFAALRQRAALRRVFASMPGAADLRDRLDSQWIATAAEGLERRVGASTAPAHPAAPHPARVRAVRWSGVPIAGPEAAALVRAVLGSELAGISDGGAGSDKSDAALCAELAAAADPPALLVKAWEPPLAEFSDWLGELRAALGDGAPIFVLPVAEPAGGPAALAAGRDARIWSRGLDAAGDPWLFVVAEDNS